MRRAKAVHLTLSVLPFLMLSFLIVSSPNGIVGWIKGLRDLRHGRE